MRAQVEKVVGKKAVLVLEDGQRLSVDKEALWPNGIPADPQAEPFAIEILPESEAKMERDALARSLLNQLLADPTGSPHAKENDSGE